MPGYAARWAKRDRRKEQAERKAQREGKSELARVLSNEVVVSEATSTSLDDSAAHRTLGLAPSAPATHHGHNHLESLAHPNHPHPHHAGHHKRYSPNTKALRALHQRHHPHAPNIGEHPTARQVAAAAAAAEHTEIDGVGVKVSNDLFRGKELPTYACTLGCGQIFKHPKLREKHEQKLCQHRTVTCQVRYDP